MTMDCAEARGQLLDLHRARLAPATAEAVRAHLVTCDACRHEDEAEGLLDRALAERLPRQPAPAGLRRRVEAMARAAEGARRPRARALPPLRRALAPALAVGLAVLSAVLLVDRQRGRLQEAVDQLGGEVVTDHLRLLASAHPLDLESGAHHEVKPWFEGRLDFAPAVPPGGGDLRLLGGSVGYVLDRKAAIVSYALGRHRVTLLAVPAAGLAWPPPDRSAGGVPVRIEMQRGFRVVYWRSGDLGYALVSDVNPADLERVAAAFAPATR